MVGKLKFNKTLAMVSGIAMILMILAIAVFFYVQRMQHGENSPVPAVKTAVIPAQQTEIATAEYHAEQVQQPEQAFEGLVAENLLEQPIPPDNALIKDEISQLKDIQSQLQEQKELLQQQHQDADKLLQLKEQQLADMEKQLKS
jgi:hypothetical protein